METRFNATRADAAVDFFARRLRHTKSRWRGTPFILDDWQEHEIVRPLFGWERFSEPLGRWVRLYRKAYIELPKKSGKSELGAGVGLYCLHADGEGGPEVFSIAADKKQAGLVFNVGADMIDMDPTLRKRSQVARSRVAHHGVVYVPSTGGVWKVLPGDAGTNDGINPSAVILDELHRQPGRELYDLMDESFGTRDEPLYVILTTAGHEDPTHVSWEVHEYARKVAEGVITDPYFFPYMRFLTPKQVEGDRWRDEDLWREVNPSLAGFNPAGIDEMRRLAAEAAESPAKVAAFKRYRLNVWLPKTAASTDKLVSVAAWDRSAGHTAAVTWPDVGNDVYVGVDMAASLDIAALVGMWPTVECGEKQCQEKRCWTIRGKFWIPESNLTKDGQEWSNTLTVLLTEWAREGWIETTEGDIIDDRDIHDTIREWATRWNVKEIAKDPWQSKQLGVLLGEDGFEVWDHPQTMAAMADPTDQFINAVHDRRMHHGGDPVLRWMVSNAIGRTDNEGRVKPDKKRSEGKIDGIVAGIMSLSAALRAEHAGEVRALLL